jgi:hypothetical protein
VGGGPFDYHLTATSAAIDQGNPDFMYNDPDGTRNDCGAFPYNQGPVTPVELAAFSAAGGAAGVRIFWSTAAEIDCYGWYVERSQDGSAFAPVSDLIAGFGTSVEPHDYRFVDLTAQHGQSYSYRLQQIDLGGAVTYTEGITVVAGAVVSRYGLAQNYPNPFNATTVASFELRDASFVRLRVYDTAGRLVATLVDGWRAAGSHEVTFDPKGAGGAALVSGIYIYCLQTGEFSLSGKMALMK